MIILVSIGIVFIICMFKYVTKSEALKAVITCERNASVSKEKDIENKLELVRNELSWSTSWLIKTIDKKARATKYISELKKELKVKDKIINNLNDQNLRNKYDIRDLVDENRNLRILLKIEGKR